MAASRTGGVTMELTEQSKINLDLQLKKLNKLGSEAAYNGLIKILFDIKALAQNKLKYDKHIITSRLRNSIYVQTPKKTTIGNNSETYTDNNGNKRKSVTVVANNVSFCGSKAENGSNSNPVYSQPAPSYASASNSDFEEIVDDDDDLPF